ncbi:MAG: CDP-alcohol phosphatidyltransferase family protein [Acidobacteria bacterium]|nr:CDP-alcohol phosphatidyltransferase family protein [Acidobacteriota bacterium]
MGLTLANLVTIGRMTLIPAFILSVVSNRHGWALSIFILAGLTDALDGLIARWWNQRTSLGAFLDPMADKLLLTAAFVVLSLPDQTRLFPELHLWNRIPFWLVILAISRDVFIVLIALLLHLTAGLVRFPPTTLGKWTTLIQTVTISLVLLFNYLQMEAPILIPAFCYLAVAITLASGFHYIYHATHRAARPAGSSAQRNS